VEANGATHGWGSRWSESFGLPEIVNITHHDATRKFTERSSCCEGY